MSNKLSEMNRIEILAEIEDLRKTQKEIAQKYSKENYEGCEQHYLLIDEGISVYEEELKKYPAKNKVKRAYKFDYNIGGGFTNTKYAWRCVECNKVWFSRDQASLCASRNHVFEYMDEYGIKHKNMMIT